MKIGTQEQIQNDSGSSGCALVGVFWNWESREVGEPFDRFFFCIKKTHGDFSFVQVDEKISQ